MYHRQASNHPEGMMKKSLFIGIVFSIMLTVFVSSCGTKAIGEVPATLVAVDESRIISPETVDQLEPVFTIDLPGSFINTIAFLPDSSVLITADSSGEILVWDRETWAKIVLIPAHVETTNDASENKVYFGGSMALSPDGDILVNAHGEDGEVTGYDMEGNALFTFAYNSPVYA
ncbi:WD40 repeat domain-containing protein, partial [bacterium]|nr:WD40 repeat domain-containing protein [bacterium]